MNASGTPVSGAPLSAIVTAEHGGNEVPEPYRELFAGRGELLASHRGWDPGSLELAHAVAAALGAPLVASTVSRLVVDLNRSRGHPRLFSEVTRALSASERREIVARYHLPHRGRVEALVADAVAAGRTAVQLAVHTFTPVLDGVERRADVGLLFDPRRPRERALAGELRDALRDARPDLRVRRNYPYLGRADGLVTTLRRRFADGEYLGLEIEVNQKWPLGDSFPWQRLVAGLVGVLAARFAPAHGAAAAVGRRRSALPRRKRIAPRMVEIDARKTGVVPKP